MRIPALTASIVVLVIAALGVGCGSKTSTDLASPTSTAPGTPVKQPLGASSASGTSSARPAPAH
jgi:hypothetical protein